MKNNQKAEPAMVGNLSSFVSIHTLFKDTDAVESVICNLLKAQSENCALVADLVATDVATFVKWYDQHLNFLYAWDHLEFSVLRLEKWTQETGVGSIVHYGGGDSSAMFSGIIARKGTIWLELPLNGSPIQIREELASS